jgi:hypothetical protein
VGINVELKRITKGLAVAAENEKPKSSKGELTLLLLPSPIQMPTYSDHIFTKVGNFIVKWFVGLVFNLLPFIASLIITFKTNELISNKFIFVWDVICVSVMLITFVATFFSYSSSKYFESYESAV